MRERESERERKRERNTMKGNEKQKKALKANTWELTHFMNILCNRSHLISFKTHSQIFL